MQDVRTRHGKGAAGQVLHAGVVVGIFQLLCHPQLRLWQVHPPGYDEEQAETLDAGRDVHQQYILQQALLHEQGTLLFPPLPGIRDVVLVVHGESAGHGIGIQAASAGEGGMRGEHGQLLLQTGLRLLVLLLHQLAVQMAFVGFLDFGAYLRHTGRIDDGTETLGRTFRHFAFYIFGYSKHGRIV